MPTDPVPTDPVSTDPAPTDPVPTDPAPTDPVSTDSVAAGPVAAGPVRSRWALATLLGVLFLTFLDTTVVTVVLGDMQYTLGAGVIPLQWVVNAYALVFAALLLFGGSLGDRWGRKRLMLVGIAVFCAGSVMCAVAPGVGWLIAGRAVMGVGAAASEPGTLSVIRQMYPAGVKRARAIGAWAAVSGLALALGPVIGGILAAGGDWRTVFWFNLVLGAVLGLAAWRWVPHSRDPQPGRLDIGGLIVGAVALGSLIFAGMFGEQHGYLAPWVLVLFAVALLGGVAFVLVEKRVASPVVVLADVRRRGVPAALFVAFAIYFGLFSIFFFTALYLDLVEGYSGLRLAALFGPMAALIVAGSVAAGFWVGRAGVRAAMTIGAVVGAAGILATRAVLTDTPGFAALSVSLAVAGLGFGIAVVPATSTVLTRIPPARSGMAAGLTNTARQFGAVVGVTLLGALVNGAIRSGFGADMAARGVPAPIKDMILGNLETGGDAAKGLDFAHPNMLLAPFVDSAASAMRSGIHLALYVSAAVILVSAGMTLFSRRARLPASAPD